MLEDLTMIATLPVDEAAVKKAKDEARQGQGRGRRDHASPKETSDNPADDTTGRIARRGPDPPDVGSTD